MSNEETVEFNPDPESAQVILNIKSWFERKQTEVVALSATGEKAVSITDAEHPYETITINDPVELSGFKRGLLVAAQMMGNFPIEIELIDSEASQED